MSCRISRFRNRPRLRLAASDGFTLARVALETGRKHQIRVHAKWLGHSVVGDKIYGPDDRLFLEFIATGWTPALAEKLLLSRQALHCAEIDLQPAHSTDSTSSPQAGSGPAGKFPLFRAPLPADMAEFCAKHGLCEHPTSNIEHPIPNDKPG